MNQRIALVLLQVSQHPEHAAAKELSEYNAPIGKRRSPDKPRLEGRMLP